MEVSPVESDVELLNRGTVEPRQAGAIGTPFPNSDSNCPQYGLERLTHLWHDDETEGAKVGVERERRDTVEKGRDDNK